ncbi:MAG: acyl-CoA thioesterase II [Gammaproteobacteria bacterium]|nr:acyl-CoA thioesterase II [Gammaproteobacteria bacterium]
MNRILQELVDHLTLERLEKLLFRGESRDIGSPRVFGGQVLGQALSAAQHTVRERPVHSLHAYFLRPGDINHPIIYEVDRARDGTSFSMRRVVAIQHGHQIFNLSASFHKNEKGLEHQFDAPEVAPPEALRDSRELLHLMGDRVPAGYKRFYERSRPFEFRFVQEERFTSPGYSASSAQIWFKTLGRLPDDDNLHRTLLAYVSDYHLIRTATLPHGVNLGDNRLQMASLDHAMWFHRFTRVDDWLLYSMDSPSTGGARGLARGTIYDRGGQLIASTAQEGLVRLKAQR